MSRLVANETVTDAATIPAQGAEPMEQLLRQLAQGSKRPSACATHLHSSPVVRVGA